MRTDAAAVLVSERARVELCEPEWTEVVDADFTDEAKAREWMEKMLQGVLSEEE